MRDAENIREVEALGKEFSILSSQFSIYMMGFIFWPKSSRYVAERPAYLPTRCKRVGVFVDADVQEVWQKVEDYGLDFIQLHGHETPEYIRALQMTFSEGDGSTMAPTVIKAFNIATAADFAQTEAYEGLVGYFLFDTKGKSVGGNGEKFDWSVLADYVGETPFLLSGGIGPDDAARIKAFHHPRCIGIDLNSRFECSPGVKDIQKLSTFLKNVSR